MPVFARECAYLILYMSLAARCSHSTLQDQVNVQGEPVFIVMAVGFVKSPVELGKWRM